MRFVVWWRAARSSRLKPQGRILSRLLADAIVAIGGCASEPHLMPTPAVFKDDRLDFTPALPAALRSTELPVFFATTRAPVAPGEPGHYANAAGDGVTLGVAEVRLGEPGWTWGDLAASDRTRDEATQDGPDGPTLVRFRPSSRET